MKTYLLLVVFCCSVGYAQNDKKLKLSDSIPGWFRFEKNSHCIRFFAGMNVFERRVEGVLNASMYAPAVTIGYGYIPIKRLQLSFDFIYEYSFNNPHYDHQSLNYIGNASYIFWGENRIFASSGFDFHVNNYIYTIHPDVPERTFFGDSVPDVLNSHYLFQLRPVANFGFNIGNNMTVQIGLGYNFIIQRPSGKLPTAPVKFNINFSYFLPRKRRI